MKSIVKISGLVLLILSINLFNSCKKEKSTPPVITTTAISEVTFTTAISGGNVTDEGSSAILSKGICWNTSADPTIENSIKVEVGTQGSFTSNITQLTPNTLYYVRAFATNNAGTSYGNQLTFTTSQIEVPVLTTTEISSITQTTAVSGGNITDEKGGSVTERGVCYGLTENPTTLNSKTSDGTGTGSFASTLTALSGNTTFYLRAYATNSAGTQYGNQVSFKTSPVVPTLSTKTASSSDLTSCISGGNVTDDGGASVTVVGVCWNTTQNPTISDNKTENGSGTGTFTSSITGLTVGTTYYIRAYATNSVGTQYGNQVNFLIDPLNIADIDGNVYDVIRIGTQLWLAENLKTTNYNDGTVIPLVTENDAWGSLIPGYCWFNNDEGTYKDTYGALYNWYAVSTGKICPAGWHVPTDIEWTTLGNYLITNGFNYDGTIIDNKIAKSLASTADWGASGVIGAVGNTDYPSKRNVTGFTALSGGFRALTGTFYGLGSDAIWWSNSEYNPDYVWNRSMKYNESKISSLLSQRRVGCSVRCLKDN